jgi:hypothetical protein
MTCTLSIIVIAFNAASSSQAPGSEMDPSSDALLLLTIGFAMVLTSMIVQAALGRSGSHDDRAEVDAMTTIGSSYDSIRPLTEKAE